MAKAPRPAKSAVAAPVNGIPAALAQDVRPGQSFQLLQALHILTRDGKINQDSRRKLKQVYHLYQFIEPLLRECIDARGDMTLVDHGAGKSYLGFILYDLYLKHLPVGHIHGVEHRKDLVASGKLLAAGLDFARMHFHDVSVQTAMQASNIPAKVDIVTALHACDTATDDAIRFALDRDAQAIVLVPCCQAEVAATLRQHKNAALSRTPLAELWRHPIHSREFGSHVTNVLRCLLLQAHGYQVTVTELVGWEHSMKNELIIAKASGQRNKTARNRAEYLITELGLETLGERFLY